MKRCTKCGSVKDISEYHKNKRSKDGKFTICKKCILKACTKYNREVKGYLPMWKNKKCPQYLGIAVAERLISHLFKDVVRMPNGNPGFDFICAKNMKIDIKSACITMHFDNKNPNWRFAINKNQTADYFLLLAFDTRESLEPLHQWLIPGDILNHRMSSSISPSTISKWSSYEQPVSPAQICCNIIKKTVGVI